MRFIWFSESNSVAEQSGSV